MVGKFDMAIVDPVELARAVKNNMFGADTDSGFCRACGAERDGTEPDACNYECDECGRNEVFGASELMMMGYKLDEESLELDDI